MAIVYRTVFGRYLNIDGSPKKGYVKFTPTTDVVSTDEAIIPLDSVVMHLDDTGYFSGALACTDSPDVLPVGWIWSVEEKVNEGEVWWFELPMGDLSPYELLAFRVPGLKPPGYAVVGPTGPQGPQGPMGPSFNVKGEVANVGLLPGTGNTVGDTYLVTDPDPDEIWAWGTEGWKLAGNSGVPGPIGPQGPQGIQGEQGLPGEPGSIGGSIVSGWWNYSNLETPPPNAGGIRTTPTPAPIGSTVTIYLHKTDADGLDWSILGSQADVGDTLLFRSATGEYSICTIETIVDNVDYVTCTATVDSGTGTPPKKNTRVQIAVNKGPTIHGNLGGLDADDHPQYLKKAGDTVTGDLTVDGNLNIWQIDAGGYDVDIRENLLIGSGKGSNGTVYVDRISPNNSPQITALASLILPGNPTVPLHAATKDYVDRKIDGGRVLASTTVLSGASPTTYDVPTMSSVVAFFAVNGDPSANSGAVTAVVPNSPSAGSVVIHHTFNGGAFRIYWIAVGT